MTSSDVFLCSRFWDAKRRRWKDICEVIGRWDEFRPLFLFLIKAITLRKTLFLILNSLIFQTDMVISGRKIKNVKGFRFIHVFTVLNLNWELVSSVYRWRNKPCSRAWDDVSPAIKTPPSNHQHLDQVKRAVVRNLIDKTDNMQSLVTDYESLLLKTFEIFVLFSWKIKAIYIKNTLRFRQ